MPESHDPLRSLFHEAAESGQRHAAAAPVAHIAERGRRARRRRMAAFAAGACLVLAGSGTAAAAYLPGSPHDSVPATSPSPPGPSGVPSPTLSTSLTDPPATGGGTRAPSGLTTGPGLPGGPATATGHDTATGPAGTGAPLHTTRPPTQGSTTLPPP